MLLQGAEASLVGSLTSPIYISRVEEQKKAKQVRADCEIQVDESPRIM
jgi:hypothetical protein